MNALQKTYGDVWWSLSMPSMDDATMPNPATVIPRQLKSTHEVGGRRSTTRRPARLSTSPSATRFTGTHGGYSSSRHRPSSSCRSHPIRHAPSALGSRAAARLMNHPSILAGDEKFHTRVIPSDITSSACASMPAISTPTSDISLQVAASAVSRTASDLKLAECHTVLQLNADSASSDNPAVDRAHWNHPFPNATERGRVLKRIHTDLPTPRDSSQLARSRPPALGQHAKRRKKFSHKVSISCSWIRGAVLLALLLTLSARS
mmetsp:Transcript_13244/g.36590  ORF Transcript_13244/g.36590 Transcript_13244/m.36590 type:complete len:262 (+) Transcript_13244:607-1392(+)